MNNNIDKIETSDLKKYIDSSQNISRACSTIIENNTSIFLPLKRIDKSHIFKTFIENNQILEVQNNLFEKVEIRARLLNQQHKDILEALLTETKFFSKKTTSFKVRITAFQLLKKLKKATGNKKWLIQKINEIAECRIQIYYKDSQDNNKTFNFNFIESIHTTNENELEINFSTSYTQFMIHTDLLQYDDYVESLLKIDEDMRILQRELKLKKAINTDFLKAAIRYMLVHSDSNTVRKIDTFIKDLNLKNILSEETLKDCIAHLNRSEIKIYLLNNFQMLLSTDKKEKTITFNSASQIAKIEDFEKRRYFIQKKFNLTEK